MKLLIFSFIVLSLLLCPSTVQIDRQDLNSLKISKTYIKIPRSSYEKRSTIKKFYKYINMLCIRHKLPIELMYALISVESKFKLNAKSHRGAYGLMQVTKIALIDLNRHKIAQTPRSNLKSGFKYYSRLYRRYKSHSLSLAAYNAGPSRVRVNGEIPNIRETRNYVKKVLALSNSIKILKWT